ncbi:uncharacterized protein LOC143288267 [Babylonia areolata]|uniref:uncharacterized protein LOC143288267 n=1 Tax=Babylonia areolata TaxID=304850 RepID=UPI003FCF17F9
MNNNDNSNDVNSNDENSDDDNSDNDNSDNVNSDDDISDNVNSDNINSDDDNRHRTIAPKKSRLIEASKVKRGLEKQLKASIEQDAMSRAAHAEPKTLTILKSSAPSGSSESKPGASKSKKKT